MIDDYECKLDDILYKTCNNAVHKTYDYDFSFPYLISIDEEIVIFIKQNMKTFLELWI